MLKLFIKLNNRNAKTMVVLENMKIADDKALAERYDYLCCCNKIPRELEGNQEIAYMPSNKTNVTLNSFRRLIPEKYCPIDSNGEKDRVALHLDDSIMNFMIELINIQTYSIHGSFINGIYCFTSLVS